jgi:hypothetical protein
VRGHRGAEGCDHNRAGDAVVASQAQHQPGMVVRPAQDLGAGAVGERVVGEVGLPALVRQLGFEPQVGRLRPLLRLRSDQAGPGQVRADGRGRYPPVVVMFRCQRIVCGPASRPCPASSLRSPTIRSAVSPLIADGEVAAGTAARTPPRLRPDNGPAACRSRTGPPRRCGPPR